MKRPLPDEPAGWRKLCAMAQEERDPTKLATILERINGLLTAHEKQSANNQKQDRHLE
jgi:hypothetical protein